MFSRTSSRNDINFLQPILYPFEFEIHHLYMYYNYSRQNKILKIFFDSEMRIPVLKTKMKVTSSLTSFGKCFQHSIKIIIYKQRQWKSLVINNSNISGYRREKIRFLDDDTSFIRPRAIFFKVSRNPTIALNVKCNDFHILDSKRCIKEV